MAKLILLTGESASGVCVLAAQLCPTLCNPMDCSPPGSPVHGILQARIMEWVAISFSRGSSRPRDRTRISCITGGCFTILATREAWSESHSVMSDSLWPHGLYSSWNSPGQNTGVGSCSLLQGIFPTQGSNPGLPHLPVEPQGEPKNTGVGNLSLLQQIFPTQESNQGPLHCRWILYQLSYQRCPSIIGDGALFLPDFFSLWIW